MKSMTGFGRGEANAEGYQISIDISSVNRKQLDIRFSPPREAIFLESLVRKSIPKHVARGVINVQMKLNNSASAAGAIQFNDDVIKSYISQIQKLNNELDLQSSVSMSEIFLLPGAVQTAEAEINADILSNVANEALVKALAALVQNRTNEGAHLKTDLTERQQLLLSTIEELKEISSNSTALFREKLEARIRDAELKIELDSERIHQEVVLYADRSDITEELVRLDAHIKQFAILLEKKGPVGRELDFLMQEMSREVNTTGSKSSDREVSRLVVTLKTELERCREQVQNVE